MHISRMMFLLTMLPFCCFGICAATASPVQPVANPDGTVVIDHVASRAQLRGELERLRAQSLKDCLSELPRTNMFFWKSWGNTGGMSSRSELPRSLNDREEQYAVDAVLGSPRVRRMLELAVGTSRDAVAALVRAEVERLLSAYREAFASNENMQKTEFNSKEYYKALEAGAAPGYVSGVGMVEHTPDEETVTVEGLRFAIMAYAWLIGELELKEAQDVLATIVDEAVQQRIAIADDEHFADAYKLQLMERLALYNRTLMGTALLRITKPEAERAQVTAALGLTTKSEFVLHVDAEWLLRGEYKRYDAKDGTEVQLYHGMTDAQFDALRAALR